MRISDWSSDVCSSDLTFGKGFGGDLHRFDRAFGHSRPLERIGEVEPCADVAQIFQQRAALLGKAGIAAIGLSARLDRVRGKVRPALYDITSQSGRKPTRHAKRKRPGTICAAPQNTEGNTQAK